MRSAADTTWKTIDHEPLLDDKVEAAYHLALLDEPYRKRVSWQLHRGADGQADAAAAFYNLNRPTIVFLLGRPDALRKCLTRGEPPRLAYAAYFPEHTEVLNELYRIPRPVKMQRMALNRSDFALSPRDFKEDQPKIGAEPVVLRGAHLELLTELYSLEPGFRPDQHQYATGGYMGIFGDGKLLTAAGTHFISGERSFAMIGNVITRPSHRRLGLARRVVVSQLARLFNRVDAVCLNVSTINEAAVKMYESLGFSAHCTYYEGAGLLRGTRANAV